MIAIPGGWPVPTELPKHLRKRVLPDPVLSWQYCECGCKCHTAHVFNHQFSIHNTLNSDTPLRVFHGHGTGSLGKSVGPAVGSFGEAEQWIKVFLEHNDHDFFERSVKELHNQIEIAKKLFQR